MIDLNKPVEDLIRDANTWKPLNVSPAERLMVFESGSQSYVIHTGQHIVCVHDDYREGANWYWFDEDEFQRLMDALNFDE